MSTGVQSSDGADRVPVSRDDLLRVYRCLERLTVGLDRVGSSAASHEGRVSLTGALYLWDLATHPSLFHDVAHCRSLIYAYFSDEIGPDGMEELERETQDLEYWSVRKALGRLCDDFGWDVVPRRRGESGGDASRRDRSDPE